MKELAGRLAAYDPEIGDAVRAISYFDELLAHRGGLESIVRGVAVLAGAPARLVTASRRIPLRVLPDGRRDDHTGLPSDDWQSTQLPDLGASLWLERARSTAGIDAMILERAAIAVRTVLDRTPLRQQPKDDPALTEIVLDRDADPIARAQAARSLGIKPGQLVRAIAESGRQPRLELVNVGHGAGAPPATNLRDGVRTGVGPVVAVEDAPGSARDAALALRFAIESTPSNPDRAVVHSDLLGALTVLTTVADRGCGHPDIDVLKSSITHGPSWLVETLDALATTDSLRAAARALIVHHSTLQNRLSQICRTLGWDVTTPGGKLRLQVTLLLWRLTSI